MKKINNHSLNIEIAARQNVKERDFWLRQLSGDLVKINFPYDYERKDKNVYSFEETRFSLNGRIYSQLIKLSSGSIYTLNVILLTSVTILLHKYTGATDIIVGVPVYKQEVEAELINTALAIRSRFDPRITFKELLIQVSQAVTEATANYNYPLELLPTQLNKPYHDGGDFPLFDTAVLLNNIHEKTYIRHFGTNMVFSFGDTGKTVEGNLHFNSLCYDRKTIERIIIHFTTLLETALFNIELELPAVEILSAAEKLQLIFDFNNVPRDYPKNRTLHQLFEEQAEKSANNIALVLADRQITYQELNSRANRLAQILRNKGVGPDGIVGLFSERSIHMMVGILGILKAGGAYLPIAPDTPGNRLTTMLRDCRAPVLLTDSHVGKRHSFTSLQDLQRIELAPCVTGSRPQIPDLDHHPIPDRSLVDYEAYNRFIGQAMVKNSISIQASRGCPYNCAYCHKLWPKNHVVRSAENIFAEVQLYYDMGVRKFAFIDDIFNLDKENSKRFFTLILEKGLDIQFFFPNGMRADILTKEYIDLMIKAGTVSVAFALETASPRIQKLIRKNLQLKKFRENIEYLVKKYPHVILELFTMHGFPTETEDEARETLDFIKSIKWIHFPYVFILKIYPKTDMAKLAEDSGISPAAIADSENLLFHELPDTLPFNKNFTLTYQADFFNNYFLSKERLLRVLPYQMKILTEDEILQKYNSYLPKSINSLAQLMEFFGVTREELSPAVAPAEEKDIPGFNEKARQHFPAKKSQPDALRILLLDLSQNFSEIRDQLRLHLEAPLGLMYILTYLNRHFGRSITGRIAKAQIDFDNYRELKALLEEFKPDVIGIRSLSFFKNFVHRTAAMIRQWGFAVPIIAGGPYATSAYEMMLQDKNIDLAVLGEGEITFAELIRAIRENDDKLPPEEVLKKIKGTAFIPRRKIYRGSWGREILMFDTLENSLPPDAAVNPPHKNRSTDLAYVIFTSGSTGRPKGTLTNHYNAVRVVKSTNYIELGEKDRVLQLSNYAFDGSIFDIYGALLNGSALVLMSGGPIGLDEVARLLVYEIVTVFFVTTALFNLLVQLQPQCLKNVKKVLFGGEKVSIEITAKALADLGKGRILHMYGPTETTVYASFYPVDQVTARQETVPIGGPLANTTIYILDKNLKPVPIGGYGEIYIGGDGLARGYLNTPQLTAKKFVRTVNSHLSLVISSHSKLFPNDRLYQTGDLGRWLPDGNIEFIGRIDQQVKIRGFRIEMGDIESQLLKHEHIKEAVVLSREAVESSSYRDTQREERYLCAYITVEKKLDNQKLKKYLGRELPDYMIPLYIEQLDKMPLTPNGKIDRKALLPPELKAGPGYVAPGNEVEEKLAAIWSEVLGIEPESIGIDDDFFDLGGHSLKATILISKLHQACNVKIPVVELFRTPTIRELASFVKMAPADAFTSIKSVEKKEYYKLSSAQKRLYVLQQMEVDSTNYNIPMVFVLEGKWEAEKMEETSRKLLDRHEGLRTSFIVINEDPVQKIAPMNELKFAIVYYESVQEEEIIRNFMRPFDLSRVPLLRVGVIKLGEERNLFMADMHHIITDGMSMNLFINEFTALSREEELEALRIQYKDYSEWQNSEMQQKAIGRQEEYWLKQFQDKPLVMEIPIDFPRPGRRTYEGNTIHFEITHQETQKLRELAKKENATMFMVALSLFNVLLYKITFQEDIVVGTAAAGRNHADLAKIIGFLVNTIVIRNYPKGDQPFINFFREVRNKTLEAFENQDYQFEDLVEKLKIKRELNRNPLFDVLFTFASQPPPRYPSKQQTKKESSNLIAKPYGLQEKEQTKFDLLFFGGETRNTLTFGIQYSKDIFKKETIEKFSLYFKKIVSAVMENKAVKLMDIKIIHDLKTASSDVYEDKKGVDFEL